LREKPESGAGSAPDLTVMGAAGPLDVDIANATFVVTEHLDVESGKLLMTPENIKLNENVMKYFAFYKNHTLLFTLD
jgi:hypothetical protein